MHIENRTLILRNQSIKIIAQVQMIKKLFIFNIKHVDHKCLNANLKDSSWIWHLRLGYLNLGALKLLSNKRMLEGLPHINSQNKFCEACILDKQLRKSFTKESIYHVKRPLELIHSDICGPISPTSYGEHCYFLTFIDNFSRKTWV